MNPVTIIGLTAAILTTLAPIPQLIKIFRQRETKDISLVMYIVVTIGIALWMIYGFLINNLPIILANIVTLIVTISILFLKIRYG